MDQKVILQKHPPENNLVPSPKFVKSSKIFSAQDSKDAKGSESHESFFNYQIPSHDEEQGSKIVDEDEPKVIEVAEEVKR